MKTKTHFTYTYDPGSLRINIFEFGQLRGGFVGQAAEREFSRLLESGAEINITDMTDDIRKAKVRRLRAIWIKQGIDQYRDSILSQYGVSSTADLSIESLNELIDQYTNKAPATDHVRRQRSIILDLLTKLGIYKNNGDWERVNAYLMQPRIAGKLIYQMNSDELNACAKRLRAILLKKDPVEREIERQSILN
ncbi:MAG: hypothetical protein PHG67_06015 [Bacteroidales bacterium]|nr:hypothetical protein [Bacteroidales bacterium]HOI31196.1 hypothetical protein [Bacteroidales bacterium]